VTILKKSISVTNRQLTQLIIIKISLVLKLVQIQRKLNNKIKSRRLKTSAKTFTNNNPNHRSLTQISKSILILK